MPKSTAASDKTGPANCSEPTLLTCPVETGCAVGYISNAEELAEGKSGLNDNYKLRRAAWLGTSDVWKNVVDWRNLNDWP